MSIILVPSQVRLRVGVLLGSPAGTFGMATLNVEFDALLAIFDRDIAPAASVVASVNEWSRAGPDILIRSGPAGEACHLILSSVDYGI